MVVLFRPVGRNRDVPAPKDTDSISLAGAFSYLLSPVVNWLVLSASRFFLILCLSGLRVEPSEIFGGQLVARVYPECFQEKLSGFCPVSSL